MIYMRYRKAHLKQRMVYRNSLHIPFPLHIYIKKRGACYYGRSTQPMFPVSEPESISAPQEPVIVTDPTPHTKKKKHNGDCMGMQLLLTGILAAAVFSLRWVNASYQTALLQLYQTHFQAPAEPLLAQLLEQLEFWVH